MMNTLTKEHLMDLLHYNPDTGVFVWIKPTRKSIGVGRPAGCVTNDGYLRIRILGHRYQAHRLAWLYMTGSWPVEYIDHINGDRLDNGFANLRIATNSQNSANQKLHPRNTSGFKGVSKSRGRWQASICKNQQRKKLGRFDTPEEAHEAYKAAAVELHGEFARFA